ncbi:MAG TPA: RNA polymerase sigma factor [Vicinamibacterales bacterium]|jgi:RNA polymerase sigma-70 factor (ECF subfamily)|nr:RNA polymerase sigma factor [Vicinamibacterales bacterium]
MTASRQRMPDLLPSKAVRVSRALVENDDLVARCQAGDVDAFEELYRLHSPRIYSLACRMTGSPQEGEDLLQDIFLHVHRKLGSFRGDAALGTWLYRLAMNQCLDFVRSRQARMKGLTDTFEEDGSNEPAAPREAPITRLDLERAVQRLPDGYRAAFVLHDVEGLDHKQIAGMLGISEGTSRSQVFKARLKLRALLG